MYYENVVVAFEAPGPSYILEDGVSGFLCKDEVRFLKKIAESDNTMIGQQARNRVMKKFLWQHSAEQMLEIITTVLKQK